MLKEDIRKIIIEIEFQLSKWLEKKPSGSFDVKIIANEGGIRGIPKLTIEQNLFNK